MARIRVPTTRRRPQIAQAALRLVGERGLSALTMAELAKQVGVTAGALFRHFASRDEILEAAVQDAVARLEETFPDSRLPPLERLSALARERVRVVRANPGHAWLLLSEEAMVALPERAVDRLQRFVKRSRKFIVDALTAGAAAGEVRADIPAATLAIVFAGTLHMLIRAPGAHRPAFGARPRPDDVLDALTTILKPT